MKFVLDNSIAMRWLLNDRDSDTMDHPRKALELPQEGATALVPNQWALEAANVIAREMRRGNVTQADASQFIAFLSELDIQPGPLTHDRALGETLEFAKQYGLSSYDASYLELALRKGIQVATVDKALGDTVGKAGGLRVLMK